MSSGRKCDGYAHAPILEHEEVAYQSQHWSWKDRAKHPTWIAFGGSSERQLPKIAPYHNRRCNCPSHETLQHSVACLAECPLYVRNPPVLRLDSELEYTCFDYYRLKTGPGFAGYYDSSIWSALILEACFTEPVVLQAVAALGAVAYRYELGITPEAFKYCEIADRLYRAALRRYDAEAAEGRWVTRPEITMVLGKLFASFEAFQDNPETATNYMTCAYHQVFNRKLTPMLLQEQPVNVTLNLQTLRQYFLKLEHQAAYLFGISADVTWQHIWSYPPEFSMPATFISIEQAKDCLFAEVRQIWKLSDGDPPAIDIDVPMEQRKHISRLMSWSKAYARYAQVHRPTNDPLLKRIGRLLKWYREAAFLHLLIITPEITLESDDSSHAALTAHFARLLLLSDGLLNHNVPFATSALQYPTSHNKSVDPFQAVEQSSLSSCARSTAFSGTPPHESDICSLASGYTGYMGLCLGSASCRSSEIRQRIMGLLKTTTNFGIVDSDNEVQYSAKDMWDDLGLYRVAGRYSSFEELACENVLRHYHRHHQGGNQSCQRSHPGSHPGTHISRECNLDLHNGMAKKMNILGEGLNVESKWVDITYFIEARMVCLVYCKPGVSEGKGALQGQLVNGVGQRPVQGPMRSGGEFVWVTEVSLSQDPAGTTGVLGTDKGSSFGAT